MATTPPGNNNQLSITDVYSQVTSAAERFKPELLVLDTLADVYAADENNRMLAKQFVKLVSAMVREHRGTGLILAHPSLSGMASKCGTSGSTELPVACVPRSRS